MVKDVEINVDSNESGFIYSAYLSLIQQELQVLSTKKIKKFRLYIYDYEIELDFAEKFMEYVKCIKNEK